MISIVWRCADGPGCRAFPISPARVRGLVKPSPVPRRLNAWWVAGALVAWSGSAAGQAGPDAPLQPLLRGALEDLTPPEEEASIDEGVEEAGFELTEMQPARSPAPVEDVDPYAPLGVRIGAFLFYPAIEAFLGYASNVFSSSFDPEPGTFYSIAPELEVQSDWSRHSLRGFVAVDHESFFEQSGETTTALDSEIEGRLDISSRDVAGLRLAYAIVPESRGDPNVPDAVVEPPDSEVAVAEATYAHNFGRFEVALEGAVEQFTYDDALLTNGTIVDNSDRDYLEASGLLRTSFALDDDSRAVFLEVGANNRDYRREFDDNGVQRGSRGYDVMVGLSFDRGAPLSGEIAIGYQRQVPVDPVLPDIDGVAFRGSLVWQPSALTTVTFEGSIFPEESTLDPTASGALVYSADIGIEHSLLRNLIASADLAFEQSDYVGSSRVERYLLAAAGIDYLVNRWLSFQVEASYERFDSNIPGEDYEDARVGIGMRLQR